MARITILGVALLSLGLPMASAHPQRRDQLAEAYDYVVVGAGAAGLTVANRLSEDSDVTVLVIEAGDFDLNEDYMTIPGLAGGAINSKYNWNYTYLPTEAVYERNISIHLGKVVGGSTKLNQMNFDRGSKSDYDRWAELGNTGWDWDSLLPYFKKNEIFTPANDDVATEYNITFDEAAHGSAGYMHSSYSPYIWPTTENVVEAVKELGISFSVDQASNPIGAFFCPHNQDPVSVTRSCSQEAYYDTAAGRSNFHIITGEQVTRLLSANNGSHVQITGVEFAKSRDATPEIVYAKKEVIMAAGTIHTPQILQVSGIGGAAVLSSINVTTIVDLPAVGQNFHDHVLLRVANTLNAPITFNDLDNATFAAEALQEYEKNKTGPMASPSLDFFMFLPLSNLSSASEAIYEKAIAQNGTQFLPLDTAAEVVKGYQEQESILNEKLLNLDSASMELIWRDDAIILGLQHPYSRGFVKPQTSSTFDAPIANPAFLENPLDISILAEGVRFARSLVGTSAMAALEPFETSPGANVTSDADLEDYIRSSITSLFHPAGTCKMGNREHGGVVDEELKVYGVEGLRVVDASVIPLLPATHIMTTVYAIAEKAADLIKQAHSQ